MPGAFENCYQNREAKITKSFCSGIINLLFDGFTYNTRGYFASCVVFFRAPKGRGKIRAICLSINYSAINPFRVPAYC